jgi:hypothetical protein
MTSMRFGIGACAALAKAGVMHSSIGSPSVMPRPRRKVRRGMGEEAVEM